MVSKFGYWQGLWLALAGACLLTNAIVMLWTYYVAGQHGYTVQVTVNSVGEFWAEIAMFAAMLVLGVYVVVVVCQDAQEK